KNGVGLWRVGKRQRPAGHVKLKLGKGWSRRNFLAEVLLPSLFHPRLGRTQTPEFPRLKAGELAITWIGHASFLIQTHRQNLLIDPNWARWLKIVKRLRHPGISIGDLPPIDLVLVSHAHFDHLDRRSLRAVADGQPIIVPENVGGLEKRLGFKPVVELTRWETFSLGEIRVTLTPVQHWGARVLHDSHRGFGGFLIEHRGRVIFHAGDTAYFSGFCEIGERAEIEIALLPIGAYDNFSQCNVHMNPEEAIRAFLELRAKKLIPMHYGTFRLSYEPLHEPPLRLFREAIARGISSRILILKEGIPVCFPVPFH
ncbi:MAG: MBL fold metallo-hydrolase, partial [Chthoniobacterales bacterium]|nr:MBL fold metallo-hydrolase [Chthoniobacterales bacterium]